MYRARKKVHRAEALWVDWLMPLLTRLVAAVHSKVKEDSDRHTLLTARLLIERLPVAVPGAIAFLAD